MNRCLLATIIPTRGVRWFEDIYISMCIQQWVFCYPTLVVFLSTISNYLWNYAVSIDIWVQCAPRWAPFRTNITNVRLSRYAPVYDRCRWQINDDGSWTVKKTWASKAGDDSVCWTRWATRRLLIVVINFPYKVNWFLLFAIIKNY